jgi:hypothetical protein
MLIDDVQKGVARVKNRLAMGQGFTYRSVTQDARFGMSTSNPTGILHDRVFQGTGFAPVRRDYERLDPGLLQAADNPVLSINEVPIGSFFCLVNVVGVKPKLGFGAFLGWNQKDPVHVPLSARQPIC